MHRGQGHAFAKFTVITNSNISNIGIYLVVSPVEMDTDDIEHLFSV